VGGPHLVHSRLRRDHDVASYPYVVTRIGGGDRLTAVRRLGLPYVTVLPTNGRPCLGQRRARSHPQRRDRPDRARLIVGDSDVRQRHVPRVRHFVRPGDRRPHHHHRTSRTIGVLPVRPLLKREARGLRGRDRLIVLPRYVRPRGRCPGGGCHVGNGSRIEIGLADRVGGLRRPYLPWPQRRRRHNEVRDP